MSIKVEVFDGEKWHCLSSNNHEATMNALNCNLRELQQKTNDLLTQLVISGSDNAPDNNSNTEVCTEFDDDSDEN